MILSCPACATRYTIDETKLGPAGRTVRCAACKNTWHAEALAPPIELPLTSPIRETVEDLQAVKAEKVPLKYRAMVEDRKRAKAMTAQNMIWAGLGGAAVMILALAFFLRVDIVKAFPRVAGAYAMAGLQTYGTPLAFGAYDAQAKLKGGRFVVTVKAQIKNTSGKPAPVPPVKVALADATQETYDTQLMPAGGLVVPAHAMRTLVFDVADPRNMAAHVDIKFDLEAMSAKPKSGAKSSHGKSHGDSHAADSHEGSAHGGEKGHAAEPGAEDAHAEDHAAPAHDTPAHDAPAHEEAAHEEAGAGHAATTTHAESARIGGSAGPAEGAHPHAATPDIADANTGHDLKLRPSVS